MPLLYMVAGPIGNLKDITLRALEILREVDVIACEDTRHSLRLLNAYEIHKPLIACHSHNEDKGAGRVIDHLKSGKKVAYLSDAGTPGISDPGAVLAAAVQGAGFQVIPVPGPSALAAILSVVGLPGKRIVFEGFLSPKPGRRRRQLIDMLGSGDLCVLYESPYRILGLLADIEFVAPAASLVLGRELTKIHEEILRGTAAEITSRLGERAGGIKGEIVLAIRPIVDSGSKRGENVGHQSEDDE